MVAVSRRPASSSAPCPQRTDRNSPVKTLYLSALLGLLPLSCPAAQDVLIYDEDCWVAAELRSPSPDNEWEIVYTGRRHREATALQRVTTITLVHRSGQQFLLAESDGQSTSHVVLNPWSPDGKWLAMQAWPSPTAGFRFYPVDQLPQALLSGGVSFEVNHNNTRLFCEQGAWAEDGTFTFLAGISGDVAPYRAIISNEDVTVQRTGEFRKVTPGAR